MFDLSSCSVLWNKYSTMLFSSTPSSASSGCTCKEHKQYKGLAWKVKKWQHVHTHIKAQNAHLIVVRTQVLEMAKACVADAYEDGHAQDNQCEQRRRSHKTWNNTHVVFTLKS